MAMIQQAQKGDSAGPEHQPASRRLVTRTDGERRLVRPRTAGEILDDAWRLYLADAPLLLALTALTAVPAMGGLIWLLTQPVAAAGLGRWLGPGLLALWLPLLGLSAGACQELLHLRAEGKPVGLGSCLAPTLRRGLGHLTATALLLTLALPGLGLVGVGLLYLLTEPFSLLQLTLALIGLAWLGTGRWLGTAVHPLLASKDIRWWRAVSRSAREGQRQAGRALAVIVTEFSLLIFAIVNFHFLTQIGLWVAEHLAGFDLAFASAVLVWSNPVYALVLVLLAYLFLAPYSEAAGYLLHVDARARSEGLDLRYRVLRLFTLRDAKRASVVLLVVVGWMWSLSQAAGVGLPLSSVQRAREEVQAIRKEVAAAHPYPGGERWNARLRGVADRLERESDAKPERFRWLRDSVDEFTRRTQEGALQVLDGLDRRLTLLEESLTPPPESAGPPALTREQIRKLLPAMPKPEPEKPAARKEKKPPPEPKPVRRDTEVELSESRLRRGPGVVQPTPSGEFGFPLWLLLGAVLVLAVLVAAWNWFRHKSTAPPAAPAPQSGPTPPSLETILTQPDRYTASSLWKEANDLAAAGRFREAVHTLYLSVLVLLHRESLIRYERTRTNGEYVQQLRGRGELRGPFAELTNRFEMQWYGAQLSQAADYEQCRDLAQRLSDTLAFRS